MPGIMSKTLALTALCVDTPAAVTAQGLQKRAFKSIDTLKGEELASGWTNIDDMLDTAWRNSVPEKGEWLCFALRTDKRKVPAAVLKKHFDEALVEEKATAQAQGKEFVSRGRKKELKERIKLKLLVNVEPVPSVVDVAMNMHNGLLLVASASKGSVGQVVELMQENFGVNVVPFEVTADVQHVLRTVYDGELNTSFGGHDYVVRDAGCVTLAGHGGAGDEAITVAVKNDRASSDAGLEAGLAFDKLKMSMERQGDVLAWSYILDTTLTLSSLKLPSSDGQDEEDQDAAMLERLYLIEQVLGVVHALFVVRTGQ